MVGRLFEPGILFLGRRPRFRCIAGGPCLSRVLLRFAPCGLYSLCRLITLSHLIHVILRLRVRRRTLIPVHCFGTGVVGCQRQTVVFEAPTRSMIPVVPIPSALISTIRDRQTCFLGRVPIRYERPKALAVSEQKSDAIPVRMRQARMT